MKLRYEINSLTGCRPSLSSYLQYMSVCLSFSDKFSAIAATFYANENEICLKSFET